MNSQFIIQMPVVIVSQSTNTEPQPLGKKIRNKGKEKSCSIRRSTKQRTWKATPKAPIKDNTIGSSLHTASCPGLQLCGWFVFVCFSTQPSEINSAVGTGGHSRSSAKTMALDTREWPAQTRTTSRIAMKWNVTRKMETARSWSCESVDSGQRQINIVSLVLITNTLLLSVLSQREMDPPQRGFPFLDCSVFRGGCFTAVRLSSAGRKKPTGR